MKTQLLFVYCLFCIQFLGAQNNIVLYGLEQHLSVSNPFDPIPIVDSMNLVSINPFNGNKTSLFKIDEAKTVAAGSSTYNANSNQFFFWGFDEISDERIYSLDLNQGVTISNPITPESHVEIEYNYSNGKVYSIEVNNEIDLVELDLNTGVSTLVSDLPGFETTAIGNSTFDPVNNLYIGFGNSGGENRIFAVNVSTGEMIHNAVLDQSNGILLAFEYDWTNQRLLGIRQTTDSSNPFFLDIKNYLVEINLNTGTATDLFDGPIFTGAGVAVGGVAFDQQSQTFLLYIGGNYDLAMINSNTGELINVVTLDQVVYELQVDNLTYARSFLSTVPTSVKNNFTVKDLIIAPNPVEDELQVDLGDDFQAGSILEIYDLNGRRVAQNTINTSVVRTAITNLSAGDYFVRIVNSDTILIGKFIKI